jgi:sugar diacid utilization regulator
LIRKQNRAYSNWGAAVMKSLTASLIKIAYIIKKNVDIVGRSGLVIYSSDLSRCGIMIENFDFKSVLSIESGFGFYIHIENGSCEEVSLCQLILKDKISQGTADNYQQFLINILEGFEESAENSKKFSIPWDGEYNVYCMRLFNNEQYSDAYSLISNSFYDEGRVWVLAFDRDLLLIELADNTDEQAKLSPSTIKDMINSEVYTDIHIGIGGTHKGILRIKKSLEESQAAIDIGKLFNLPGNIFVYNKLLAERLVYLLPKEKTYDLCSETFSKAVDEILDGEMIKTVEVFFKNNLNVSDSSKILYIHRNTLLYRLDKIQKTTGLDVRKFDDAVTFKLMYSLRTVMKK